MTQFLLSSQRITAKAWSASVNLINQWTFQFSDHACRGMFQQGRAAGLRLF